MTWRPDDMPDQTGRTVVVTGANGGLGEVATRALVAAGATVVMACRNPDKAHEVADRIGADAAAGATRVAALDLSDLASVRRFADEQGDIDVLINNAGLMNVPFGRTKDGFETQFGVNHLGHFALTGLLLDRIGDRVVTLSSIAHRQTPKLWIDDLNYEHRWYQRNLAYAQSKLANLMFARELQRRLAESGSAIRSYAVHPGVSGTDLFTRTETPMDLVAKRGAQLVGQPPQRAVHSTLLAATMPDADPTVYWGPARWRQTRGPAEACPSSRLSKDRRLWRRLWEESERMTGVVYDFGR
ncbi:SDR family NAD(P)-dependent oxidoreductase [Mycolicibacillus parakoreensis]|uniref:Oxidoreductase n=1 Tax=Mycolicibacillus parakoreensis TaxID=1069221 RepID=A0ABY3U0F3_9MYCO|nr:oxidoreductase [Mycolicibacillus parakoreensis]MCV7316028.1 SDR family NAD(P)-dependent oxidoreductase [Mycolicibacillus parakoreensis]ULN52348.1 oxidoreductase [Mycolicibacillus parakoreensis]HLR99498.1 oxidoreductase [Mycolicibacillus parakoreensis]